MKKIKLLKLDKDKQYICVAKRSSEPYRIEVDNDFKNPIPIIYVDELDDVKFYKLENELLESPPKEKKK